MRPHWLVGLGLLACTPEVVEIAPAPTDDIDSGDTDGEEIDCELAISPEESFVLPRRDVQFTTTGGTGDVRYAFSSNTSGGLLAETSGTYLSGSRTGGRDVIEVTDLGCPGASAQATVHVLDPMVVAPLDTVLLPDTRVEIAIYGGSGDAGCEILYAPSGGELVDCVYTAGATPAIDKIRVTDAVTGQVVDAVFRVDPSAKIELPGARWAIPVDSPLRLPATGGSNNLELLHMGGVGSVEGGVFISAEEGVAVLRIRDPYTGMQTERSIDVLAPRVPDRLALDGELTAWQTVLGPGDLDGDGYDDVLLGNSEASIEAHRGGGAWVFAGGPDGLDTEPTWGWSNPQRDAYAGRALAIGDFDGDGEADLAVGSYLDRRFGTSAGAVDVFAGVPGAFFDDEPSVEIGGAGSDLMGHGLVACDFDGDGLDDLAIGSYGDEDRSQSPIAYSQGSVDIHLGSTAGLSVEPAASVYGRDVDRDGRWVGVRSKYYGRSLAAGDIDGDGRCDLLVGSYDRGVVNNGGHGAVYLHLGSDDGVEADPARVWAVVDGDSNAQFGRRIATGDIDGDGRDDVLIGAYRRDWDGSSDWGMAAVFQGGPVNDVPGTVVEPEEAGWMIYANARQDYLGFAVDLDDVDGDGQADVLIGSLLDEPTGSSGQGTVRIFEGSDVERRWLRGHVATHQTPHGLLWGENYYDWFGGSVAGVGDVDGDGTNDIAAIALRSDAAGAEVGTLYWSPWDGDGSGTAVELPQVLSGHGIGRLNSVDWVDPDGDGYPVLAVGAPGNGAGNAANVGDWWTFGTSRTAGVDTDDDGGMVFRPSHGSYDQDGLSIAAVGDMDGDGYEDLAYVSYQDSRSSNLGSTYANPTECGARGGAGAVFVVRGGRGDTLGPEPYAAQWGGIVNDRVWVVEGVGDIDADGYDDLVMASLYLDNSRGGFSIMRGGPADSRGTLARCDDAPITHSSTSTRMGRNVAALGDLDADGCADFAVSADQDDLGVTNQGSIRIFWGHGGSGCRATPEMTTITSGNSYSLFGHSLAGGEDVDGDGVLDVIVGAPSAAVEGERIGAAYLLSGADLLRLPTQGVGARLPTSGETLESRIGRDVQAELLIGSSVGSSFGWAVELLPGAVAVGSPAADFDGVEDLGMVVVHRWDGDRLDPDPHAVMVGETLDPGAWFGSALTRGDVGGVPTLAVGSRFHDAYGVDIGGVFPWFMR